VKAAKLNVKAALTNEKTTISKAESKEKAGDKKIENSIVAKNMKAAISAKATPKANKAKTGAVKTEKHAVADLKKNVTTAVKKEKRKLKTSI